MAKRFSVFGDSISTFKGMIPPSNRWYYDAEDTNSTGVASPEDTWWMRVIKQEGGTLHANASFSGSMVDGAGFPAGRSIERASQLLGENAEPPDSILVFIGINDYGWGSPEAQMAGKSEAAPRRAGKGIIGVTDGKDGANGADGEHARANERMDANDEKKATQEVDPAGPAPKDAAERFGQAYSAMLGNIRTVAPNAEVWCITIPTARVKGDGEFGFCHMLRGVSFDDYNDAIRLAARENGASVADVRAIGFDYESIDGTHPTRLGMRQFATLVTAAMAYARGDEAGARKAMSGYPENLRSECATQGAHGDACHVSHPGECCPCAGITPTRWTCVYRKE